jgi:hypothetical protein
MSLYVFAATLLAEVAVQECVQPTIMNNAMLTSSLSRTTLAIQ